MIGQLATKQHDMREGQAGDVLKVVKVDNT